MIWSVIMLFAQDSPRLWAFLPNSTGTFPHKDEQCLLILMGKNAHHDGLKSLNHNMKAASIVNEAYCVEQ